MTPFDYKYQNPLGFSCLMPFRAFCYFYSAGNTKLKQEKKNKLTSACTKIRNTGTLRNTLEVTQNPQFR